MFEQRNLKSFRTITFCYLISHILANILFHLKYLGYYFLSIKDLHIQELNHFTAFFFIALVILFLFNKSPNISDEIKDKEHKKMLFMLFLNIFFMAYIIFTLLIIKDTPVILSACIMEILYISIIKLTKMLNSFQFSNTQTKWHETFNTNQHNVNESNLLWRLKIWFNPHEHIPFSKRFLSLNHIIVMIIYMYFLYTSLKNMDNLYSIATFFLILVFIPAFKTFLSIIEYFLGLYTSLIGICTGITIPTEPNRSTSHWSVYITDFDNKRELVYKSYKRPLIYENDEVKIVHGIFSKRVITVNGFRID